MKTEIFVKALKSTAWIVFPCALISLFVCTMMMGSGLFEMLLPVWLVLIFTGISFVLTRIPFFASRPVVKITADAILAVAAALCLHFF